MSMNKYKKTKEIFDSNIVKPGELIVVREFDMSGNCTTTKGIIKSTSETKIVIAYYNWKARHDISHMTLDINDLWTGGPSGIEFEIVEVK